MNRALLAGVALTLGVGGAVGLAAYIQDDCGPESCADEIKPAAINLPDHTGTGSQWVQAAPPREALEPAGLKAGPEPEFYRKWAGRKVDGLPPLDAFARVSKSEIWGIQESREELGPAWVGTDRRYLLHTDEQGRWTKVTLPLPSDGRWSITRLVTVPGSTARWAIAADESDGGVPNRTFHLTG